MDKKRIKNTKREKIHLAMRLKQAIRHDWLRGTWQEMSQHAQQLNNIKREISCY